MPAARLTVRRSAVLKRLASFGGAIAVLAVLGAPAVLLAHAHLERSEPAANERLTSAPTAIRLWFSEHPELAFTRVRLRAADSSDVALGAVAAIAGNNMGVAAPISAPLAPGTYRVLWRTAAADGHPTSGSFTFTVAGAATAIATTTDTTASQTHDGHSLVRVDTTAAEAPPRVSANAATRWLEFMSMLAVVGVVVFRLVVLRGLERVTTGGAAADTRFELGDAARRLGQSALVLLTIAMLSRLYGEANAVLGMEHTFSRSALGTLLLESSWGMGWLVGLAGVVLAATGFTIAKRSRSNTGWVVAALGALGIVLAPALTGHAMSTHPVGLALVTDVLHVAAVCAWLGALLTLLLTAIPFVRGSRVLSALGTGPLVAALVRAFHPVALTCAAIVVATGLVASWLRLPTLASLWESTYGRVLLVKLCFVALVIVLGSLNWRRMLPRLGDEVSARRITRTAGVELTIAAVVLAVTAVLVSTSPP